MFESYTGEAGTATLVTGTRGNVTDDARLVSYLIDAPGWSPAWRHYLLTSMSLRDLEGFPPVHKDFPEAEYEISVFAVDSGIGTDDPKAPDPSDLGTFRLLTSQNVRVQFGGVDDDMAIHLGESAAKAVCDGVLIPEPEGIIGARDLWTTMVLRTIEHHKEGRHGD